MPEQTRTKRSQWAAWIADDDYAAMAEAGRMDMFAFARFILGYDKLQELHRGWCDWVTDFSSLRKLRMEPRETYKTTVFTISFILWLIVQDKETVRGLPGNNLRILLANAVGSRAFDFAKEIDGHIVRNALFRRCYGALESHGEWTGSQKTIATRTVIHKEPTLQVTGKGSQMTSAHYDVAIFDDLVNEKDRDSRTERKKTIEWLKDARSLVHQDGLVLLMGTRWHTEDLYDYVMGELNPELISAGEQPYTVVSEGCYLDDGETPRFPTILSKAVLDLLKIEKGYFGFSSQYLNAPRAPESQVFVEGELEYYDPATAPPVSGLQFYGFCDPSLGRTATADFSAIVTIAQDKAGNRYLWEADVKLRPVEALKEAVVRHIASYPYAAFGFEDNGFQDEVRKDIEKILKQKNKPFRLKCITHTGDKFARIQSREAEFKALLYREDWRNAYPEFMRQLFAFPDTTSHDDGPDAAEGCLEIMGNRADQYRMALRVSAEAGSGADNDLLTGDF
jgi:predicted phage terminase large subunit-like protein